MELIVHTSTQCVNVTIKKSDKEKFEQYLHDDCVTFDELGRSCNSIDYIVHDVYLEPFLKEVKEL